MTELENWTVDIDDIIVPQLRRTLIQTKVDELAASIREIGLLHPITITSDNILVAGAHRLEACKQLLWQDIPCAVLSCDNLRVELAEIDENLIRNDLDAISIGELALRRDDILDALGLRAKVGQGRPLKNGAESAPLKTTESVAKEIGVSTRVLQESKQLAKNLTPEAKQAVRENDLTKTDALKLSRLEPEKQNVLADKIASGEAKDFPDAVRQVKRNEVIKQLDDIAVREVKQAQGLYDVIVIDPPWPMKKIERDLYPEQVEFDYPTMTEEELAEMTLPCCDDCHLWVWTTQKFLPMALRLIEHWGFSYVCTFVWHKNGGFQVTGLPQYNCEFAVYAHKGNPKFIDTKAFFTCFEAKRSGHSVKPDEFYDMVRRVTGGRKVDMFSRREIEEFDSHGNEAQ